MSELKVYHHELRPNEYEEFYLKYEADKEIAELKEGAKKLILDNYLQTKEIRHHKYKRCLAMARWCAGRSVVWDIDGNDKKSEFYFKWKDRWRTIADQFKDKEA